MRVEALAVRGEVPAKAAVLQAQKRATEILVVSTDDGFPNKLPENVFAVWPAVESLAGTNAKKTAAKKYAVIKREAFKVGSFVKLEAFGKCEITELSDDGKVVEVQVVRSGGGGAEVMLEPEKVPLPGGIMGQLLRQLSEPWVRGLVAREAAQRERGGQDRQPYEGGRALTL